MKYKYCIVLYSTFFANRTIDLFSGNPSCGGWVFCHAQVVEDAPGAEGQFAHHLGDGLSGGLKGLEDADREAAQAGYVFRAVAGTDAAAIFVVVPIDDPVAAFDTPVTAVDVQ